jgi:hypothetical protein
METATKMMIHEIRRIWYPGMTRCDTQKVFMTRPELWRALRKLEEFGWR